jgi:hypothetical protein
MGRPFRERNNPMINEIFNYYSPADIAQHVGITYKRVIAWKYVPLEYVEKVSQLCCVAYDRMLQNTLVYMDKTAEFKDKHMIQSPASISECYEGKFAAKKFLEKSRRAIDVLKKRKLGDPELFTGIDAISTILDFIEGSEAAWPHFVKHMIRVTEEDRIFWYEE